MNFIASPTKLSFQKVENIGMFCSLSLQSKKNLDNSGVLVDKLETQYLRKFNTFRPSYFITQQLGKQKFLITNHITENAPALNGLNKRYNTVIKIK